jgi:hypothetical protein
VVSEGWLIDISIKLRFRYPQVFIMSTDALLDRPAGLLSVSGEELHS